LTLPPDWLLDLWPPTRSKHPSWPRFSSESCDEHLQRSPLDQFIPVLSSGRRIETLHLREQGIRAVHYIGLDFIRLDHAHDLQHPGNGLPIVGRSQRNAAVAGQTRRDAALRTESFLKPVSPVFLDDVSSPCREGKILVVKTLLQCGDTCSANGLAIAGKRQDFRALSRVIQIGSGGPIPLITTPTGNTLRVPIVFSASGGVDVLTA
jgi:hypothetical protein